MVTRGDERELLHEQHGTASGKRVQPPYLEVARTADASLGMRARRPLRCHGPALRRASDRATCLRQGWGRVDDNGVLVDLPSHFFKLAFDPARIEAIAFILPNRKLETKDLPKFLQSIDDIEDRARLDFLPMICG